MLRDLAESIAAAERLLDSTLPDEEEREALETELWWDRQQLAAGYGRDAPWNN